MHNASFDGPALFDPSSLRSINSRMRPQGAFCRGRCFERTLLKKSRRASFGDYFLGAALWLGVE